MAAITQGAVRKQAAMERAEALTDVWDVVKAWLGRAAEIILTLCMFAQIIGMLPGVNYPQLINNIILGIQIVMLDFGAFALTPLAEHARNAGKYEAAEKAEKMSTFLIRLVIVTIVIVAIGQFAPLFHAYAKYVSGFVIYSEPVLILVRVGCVVQYIHVIHDLRAVSTLAIQPSVQDEPDYERMASQLLPLLRNDLQALIPAQQPDYEELIARQIETRIVSIFEEKVTTLSRQECDKNATISATIDATPAPQITRKLRAIDAPKPRSKNATTGATTARQKALKLIAKNPDIEPVELARKADITASYARKILAETSQQKGE